MPSYEDLITEENDQQRFIASLEKHFGKKPTIDPTQVTSTTLVEILATVQDKASVIYVRNDFKAKEHAGMQLSVFLDLALYSSISKANEAQLARDPEPNFPAVYSAATGDRIMAGLRRHFLPPNSECRPVTCTGALYDPDYHRITFRSIWMAPHGLISKAQQILLGII